MSSEISRRVELPVASFFLTPFLLLSSLRSTRLHFRVHRGGQGEDERPSRAEVPQEGADSRSGSTRPSRRSFLLCQLLLLRKYLTLGSLRSPQADLYPFSSVAYCRTGRGGSLSSRKDSPPLPTSWDDGTNVSLAFASFLLLFEVVPDLLLFSFTGPSATNDLTEDFDPLSYWAMERKAGREWEGVTQLGLDIHSVPGKLLPSFSSIPSFLQGPS